MSDHHHSRDLKGQHLAYLRGMQHQAAKVAQQAGRDREGRAAGAGAAASLAWGIGEIEAAAALREVKDVWWCAAHESMGLAGLDSCDYYSDEDGCEPLPLYVRTGAA